MRYFAHSGCNADRSDWQLLSDHLFAVARLAAQMAEPIGLERAAFITGLFHDLGKYAPDFQRRLAGEDIRVDHSTAGARLLLDMTSSADKVMAEIIAYTILGHHAGLPDRRNETVACFDSRVKAAANLDPVWQQELAADVTSLAPAMLSGFRKGDADFALSVMGRMIFSCLVDADFKDTEQFYHLLEGRIADRAWLPLQDLLGEFTERFVAHMQGFAGKAGELNRLRAEILTHVRAKAAEKPGLFTLTVPTGGGKTLASLGFALDHARAHGLSRIIYAIPFAGAWIETAMLYRPDKRICVALLAGA